MRQIPELEFRDDRSMEYAQQITATLREIQATDAARGIRPAAEEPAAEPPKSGESA